MAKTKEVRLDVPTDLHRWIMAKAKSEGISVAALVRQTLARRRAEER